jgi:N-acetylneuraminate synthase
MGFKTLIIAEAGVNHNGKLETALALVSAAKAAGADAVKFQTFDVDALVVPTATKAEYQRLFTDATESQYEMLKKLQLDDSAHRILKAHADDLGIQFLSTAFDIASLRFLTEDLKLPILKIASGEITNGPLLLEFAKSRRNLILSTGMSNLTEIQDALSVLAFGLIDGHDPSQASFRDAFESIAGKTALQKYVTVLHCTTEYPAPYESVNLNAMLNLQKRFNLRVGYSDHTPGTLISPVAVALGAEVIEKHITIDKDMPGPDHPASLNPKEFSEMVKDVRNIEEALGVKAKAAQPAELGNLSAARKSLVAKISIKKGEKYSDRNVTAKRPAVGRSPMDYWNLIGEASPRDYDKDDLI